MIHVLVLFIIVLLLMPKCDNRKIVVVGNAGSMRGSGLGPAIDEFDVVIRVNDFKTKGFEADVGSKTTGIHMNETIPKEKFDAILKNNDIDLDDIDWLGTRDRFEFSRAFGFFPYLSKIHQYTLNTHGTSCRNFTSGTLAVLHFMEKTSNPIYTAGVTGYNSPGYYYDDSSKTKESAEKQLKKFHCPGEERKLFNRLVESGKIIRLDSPS